MRGPVATGKGRIRYGHSVVYVSYRMIVSAHNRFEAVPVERGRARGTPSSRYMCLLQPIWIKHLLQASGGAVMQVVTSIPDALERRQSRLDPTRTGRKQVILTDPCGLRRGHKCGISHEISYAAPSKTKVRPPLASWSKFSARTEFLRSAAVTEQVAGLRQYEPHAQGRRQRVRRT
jgi:hypothetical protein